MLLRSGATSRSNGSSAATRRRHGVGTIDALFTVVVVRASRPPFPPGGTRRRPRIPPRSRRMIFRRWKISSPNPKLRRRPSACSAGAPVTPKRPHAFFGTAAIPPPGLPGCREDAVGVRFRTHARTPGAAHASARRLAASPTPGCCEGCPPGRPRGKMGCTSDSGSDGAGRSGAPAADARGLGRRDRHAAGGQAGARRGDAPGARARRAKAAAIEAREAPTETERTDAAP